MSCFDSVLAPCPDCGAEVEFQSHAGRCDMKRYHHTNVPAEVAMDVNDTSEQCECGAWVSLKTTVIRVNMTVVKGNLDPVEGEDDYD